MPICDLHRLKTESNLGLGEKLLVQCPPWISFLFTCGRGDLTYLALSEIIAVSLYFYGAGAQET